ncbi:10760_t:CDS:2 [Rhizophagus irregularis]|nr:10760_t:CDS:2 [Rhizophagus irregularis]
MAKKLSLYFRNHQIPLAALRRIQKDKYRKEIGLNLPVETRWLSAYQCLDSIFKSKMTMMALLGKDITLDREIKIKILDNEFLYNPAVFVAYRLDLRYNGELLNNQRWDDIIEEELIRLVGKENQNLVLEEYSEFIRKCGVLLTIKELVKNGVTIENSEEKETEDNIEILDDFEELNEMYLEQDLSKEIEEE